MPLAIKCNDRPDNALPQRAKLAVRYCTAHDCNGERIPDSYFCTDCNRRLPVVVRDTLRALKLSGKDGMRLARLLLDLRRRLAEKPDIRITYSVTELGRKTLADAVAADADATGAP